MTPDPPKPLCPGCEHPLRVGVEMREGKAVHIVWCGNVRMCSGTVCNDGGEGATIEDAMKDLKKKFEEKEV